MDSPGELRDQWWGEATPLQGSEPQENLAAQVAALREENLRLREALATERARKVACEAEAAVQKSEWDALRQEYDHVRQQLAQARAELREATGAAPSEAEDQLRGRFEDLQRRAQGKRRERLPVGSILLDVGLITPEQLDQALSEQRHAWNRHLGTILVELGYVTEDAIAQALAAQIQAPFVRLEDLKPDPRAIALIPGQVAHHHTCLPLRLQGDTLIVAMSNPFDLVALDDLEHAAERSVEPHVAAAHDIRAALKRCYPQYVRV